ncbi:hypothetical protein [Citrobacter braakii]|uniref:hypothetical protein n=1 Tax=Citrobacter braakii TaxID=57706 RepID=UPI002B252480|nr:hypothetical protein [Citrobacter braakii]MEB2439827.1 hypothetical protein [Citrobacter braakii]
MTRSIFILAFILSGCATKTVSYKCNDLENKDAHTIVRNGDSLKYDKLEMKKIDTKKVHVDSDNFKINTVIEVFKNINGDDYVSMTEHEGKLIYVHASNLKSDKAISMGLCE